MLQHKVGLTWSLLWVVSAIYTQRMGGAIMSWGGALHPQNTPRSSMGHASLVLLAFYIALYYAWERYRELHTRR